MIAAKELMIGNYVELKDKGVYQIDRGYDLEKIEDWDGTDYCKGIPITEDWLLRFGFELFNTNYIIDIVDPSKQLLLMNVDDKIYPIIESAPEMRLENVQQIGLNYITHVHQLQNLFYSLTQQELKLKK